MKKIIIFCTSFIVSFSCFAGTCDIKLEIENTHSTRALGVRKIQTKPSDTMRRYRNVKKFKGVTVGPGKKKVIRFKSRYDCNKSQGQLAKITHTLYSTIAPMAIRTVRWNKNDLANGKLFKIKLAP